MSPSFEFMKVVPLVFIWTMWYDAHKREGLMWISEQCQNLYVYGIKIMVQRMKSFVLVAILASHSNGQLRNMAVDETQFLKSAKKVVVFINLAPPGGGPYQPDFARAKTQISKKLAKQKLQLVEKPADADIVLIVTEFNENRGATASATTYGQTTTAVAHDLICLGDEIKVFKGGKERSESDVPIWATSEICGFSWPLNRAMDKLAKAMKK